MVEKYNDEIFFISNFCDSLNVSRSEFKEGTRTRNTFRMAPILISESKYNLSLPLPKRDLEQDIYIFILYRFDFKG